MNEHAAIPTAPEVSHQIVVDEVFPHSRERIWAALTDGALMARWIMPPTGFAAVVGTRFTFQTKAGGAWDGTIHCQVVEVEANERLAYSWKGGHESNIGYGSPLDTLVTFTLRTVPGGTRLTLVHSGFALPKNESAFTNMSEGWKHVVTRLRDASGDIS
jgi:uncharacterized protein YndB with AHSA1/START domain